MTQSNNPRHYTDLRVWHETISLIKCTYQVTRKLPAAERFGLASQLQRAAVSCAANIAEGYRRATRGEYLNQLSVARGSINEVEALFTVCVELAYLKPPDVRQPRIHIDGVQRMLSGLRSSLKRKER